MIRKPRPRKEREPDEFASHTPPSASDLWRSDGKARLTVPVQQPKDEPVRHEGYRRLVAALPCCLCGIEGFSQAAHGPSLGRGIKATDVETFALCADRPLTVGCHSQFDRYALWGAEMRRTMAEKWARETRAQIKADGNWPANLPAWEDD